MNPILRQTNGEIIIPDPVPLSAAARVRRYHAALLAEVRQFTGWWEPAADPILFRQYGPFYAAVGAQLSPPINPYWLTQQSRHRFLIATDLVPSPIDGRSLPGLSQLEQMLGYKYVKPRPKPEGIERARVTTGDEEVDLMVDAAILFGDAAQWICDRFDAATVGQMVVQCIDRKRGQEAIDERQRKADREYFERNQEAIMKGAIAQGIALPYFPEFNNGNHNTGQNLSDAGGG